MKRLGLLVLVSVVVCAAARAQVTPIPPFLNDATDDFESHANQGPVTCLAPLPFQQRADICSPGALHVGNGFGGWGTIFARSGVRCAVAYDAVTIRFTPPVRRFGSWMGTVATTSGGTADFYDANGASLGSLPLHVQSCELNCRWTWNGFDAGSGPAIARVELRATSGGGGLAFDDMAALFGNGPIGATFCGSDQFATACPCNNGTLSPERGCRNSTNQGARLTVTGMPSLSGDTVVLHGASMPPNASALFFQGTARVQGGAGAVFGDGLRCAGGSVARLGVKTSVNGEAQYPAAGDTPVHVRGAIGAPGVYVYQVWYRDPADYCTPSTFNLTNGFELTWQV